MLSLMCQLMFVWVCVGVKRITHGSACLFHVSLQSIVTRLLWVPLPAVIDRSKKDIRKYVKETEMLLLEYDEALAKKLLFIFVFIGCVLFSKKM